MLGRKDFGAASEKQAEKFLRNKGHRIVARNYFSKHGEIDIISVTVGKVLVFTEVRSKHVCTYGHPIETIDERKQAHIRFTAEKFLYEHPKYEGYTCRFDVVTIVGEGKNAQLEYFPDAF